MKARSRSARPTSLVAALAAVVLIAGCAAGGSGPSKTAAKADSTSPSPAQSPAGASPPASPAPLPVIASAEPDPHQTQSDETLRTADLKLQVNSVKRDSTGVVTVTWTLVNNGRGPLSTFHAFSDEVNDYYGLSVSNVQIIDQTKQLQYHPLIDTEKICYCSQGASADDNLTADHQITLQDMFKPDPSVAKVDVHVVGFQPAKNVPVT